MARIHGIDLKRRRVDENPSKATSDDDDDDDDDDDTGERFELG